MMGISLSNVIVLVYFLVLHRSTVAVLKTADLYKQLENYCDKSSGQCTERGKEKDGSQIRLLLPRINAKEVGFTQELELIEGTKHVIRTLSLNPPIFEISNFFSDDECDMVVDLAQEKGMRDTSLTFDSHEKLGNVEEIFKDLDENKDDLIDTEELLHLSRTSDIYMTDQDVHEMFEALYLDKDSDGRISREELDKTSAEKVKAYLTKQQMSNTHMRRHSHSQEAWLWHDDDELLQFEGLLEDYHDRIAHLTQLPKPVIEQSEPVQVVRYKEAGHYHCHHDTDMVVPDKKCCLYGSTDCRLCRYLTIMVFLNDVDDGGESAFPIADNETFSWGAWSKVSKQQCHLAKYCDKSNLVIKPQKGKALMWYNHLMDPNNMWLGGRDPFSYQGSCTVRKEEKWVANIWINIIGDGRTELRAWKMGHNWLAENNLNHEIINALKSKDVVDEPRQENRYTWQSNIRDINELHTHTTNIDTVRDLPSSSKDPIRDSNIVQESSDLPLDKIETVFDREEEISVETLDETPDLSPKGPRLAKTETSSPLPLTQEKVTPQGPPVVNVPRVWYEGNRIMQSIMLLLEELDQVELEIIARNLHTKLKLVCVPLIMNPMGSI